MPALCKRLTNYTAAIVRSAVGKTLTINRTRIGLRGESSLRSRATEQAQKKEIER